MIITGRRQRRVLAEMLRALRSSDSRLVARFIVFTRLTQDEEMPPLERMRPWPLRWAASVAGRGRRGRAPVTGQAGRTAGRRAGIPRRLGAIIFIPATAAVLISVPFILGHGRPAAACAPAAAARVHTRQLPFAPPGWTAPSCRHASRGSRPDGRRLPGA